MHVYQNLRHCHHRRRFQRHGADCPAVTSEAGCEHPGRITRIERSPALGLGVGYGTTDPTHLLNVPTARISALPDDPESFLTFARREGAPDTPPDGFLPRSFYGRYVQWLLDAALASAPQGTELRMQAVKLAEHLLTLGSRREPQSLVTSRAAFVQVLSVVVEKPSASSALFDVEGPA